MYELLDIIKTGTSNTITDATISLPPGDTSANLQAAIDDAVTGDVIEISSNMEFTSTVTIPPDKVITIRSTAGNNWVLSQTVANVRHFSISGNLILQNITLDGENIGGGVFVNGSTAVFEMEDGTVIQNGYFSSGSNERGGVRVLSGTFNMNGGVIRNNQTAMANPLTNDGGGGVYMDGGQFHMSSGMIGGAETADANRARNGAGVHIRNNATFTMTGGAIQHNIASQNYGGGVFIGSASTFILSGESVIGDNSGPAYGAGVIAYANATFIMNGGAIRRNSTTNRGGGVCVYGNATFDMNGGVIGGGNEADANTASLGGGVFVNADTNYATGPVFHMRNNSLIRNNSASSGGGVYSYSVWSPTVQSVATFIMDDNSLVTENRASSSGCGVYIAGNDVGIFTMNGNSTVSRNRATGSYTDSGGVRSVGGICTMNDNAAIKENIAPEYGGGALLSNDTSFTMNGNSAIRDNAAESGGGVYVTNRYALILNDHCSISGNTASQNGGGIYVNPDASTTANPTRFIMTGGAIEKNIAYGAGPDSGGGGIYFQATDDHAATLDISGNSYIVGNDAPYGHGGGIYCTVPYWGQMNIGPDTVFRNNHASVAYAPPATVFTDYPSIQFASITISNLVPRHPLNNYDINFVGVEPLSVYTVTYHANGGQGTPPAQEVYVAGTPVTVAENTLSRDQYLFAGWNTEANGAGIPYSPGNTFIMPEADVDLYAQWVPGLTVVYNANGGIGSHVDAGIPYGSQYTVLSPNEAGISREGYTFTGWNTQPDGSGASYAPGDVIILTDSMTFFAQWMANEVPGCKPPSCKPCCGPSCNVCCRPCSCNKPCSRPSCNACCRLCSCGRSFCAPNRNTVTQRQAMLLPFTCRPRACAATACSRRSPAGNILPPSAGTKTR